MSRLAPTPGGLDAFTLSGAPLSLSPSLSFFAETGGTGLTGGGVVGAWTAETCNGFSGVCRGKAFNLFRQP